MAFQFLSDVLERTGEEVNTRASVSLDAKTVLPVIGALGAGFYAGRRRASSGDDEE